ncbi:MAG TPA: GDP-L-fucose synthase [Casimicrobiaceae bacterium]|jgi:GDP-L-fucose synthase
MLDWRAQRIVVTGGAGFLGSHVVDALRRAGGTSIVVPRSAESDLRDRASIRAVFDATRPTVVFHLAATVGGIGANRAEPGRFFYDNAVMGIEIVEAARRHGVAKLVMVGTACSYPRDAGVPVREEALWDGYPEPTNAPYGIAKRALVVQCQAYRRQYGLDAIVVVPTNLYGPRDHFDLEAGHVIPALIRKCIEARESGAPEIRCWGSGTPSRDFLYVEDAAEGLVLAAERYDAPEPVNLGTGRETTIRDLAATIARLTRYDGALAWDTTYPDGQPRRALDGTRAERAFGFRARTPFEEGLRRTVDWYERRNTL